MQLFICISDYWEKRTYYQLQPEENNNKSSNVEINVLTKNDIRKQITTTALAEQRCRTLRRCRIDIDGIAFYYLLKELLHFKEYRRILCCHPALKDTQLLWLQIVPPAKEIIDYRWNRMLARKLWEKIETDYLMSWLSTLGGGYSALGEQFSECAQVAGKISRKQLRIGIQLGDPFLQSRCLLYYSISLIQIGRLRTAKYIIRSQYAFARANEEMDSRLVKMCKGIWLRLQYEYGLRMKKKGRAIA
ncbi:uncharacterized protein F58A4.6 [Musca vetustissima]|uniref:uncharacterized protein F58A4.6 n=1 Tax=Musca vetustissima TaxID=27455 RepID=UPI002AB6767B|nr:uncharacterized protein F58A4.6 [Musca vetustissima]